MEDLLINKPLLFIVGAGASRDFGSPMPVGSELAQRIELQLNNEFGSNSDGPIKRALMRSRSGLTAADTEAADRIRRAIFAQPSIDDLLNEWREAPEMLRVGKIAIVNAILGSERACTLGETARGNPDGAFRTISGLRDCWLAYLLRNLSPGTSRREIGKVFSNVAFVTFNYDRCIEQYLYWAFQSVANLNPGNSRIAVEQIPIVHVYGDLGPLPYDEGEDLDVSFGADVTIREYIYERIKTYTEEDHDAKNLATIHRLVSHAETIVFLGVGYHERNMQLLFSASSPRPDVRIWGTSVDPDPARLIAVQERFKGCSQKPRLESFKCTQFLSMYRDAILGHD